MRRSLIPIEGRAQGQNMITNTPTATRTITTVPSSTSSGRTNSRQPHNHAINNAYIRPALVNPPLFHDPGENGDIQERPWRLFEERVRTGPFGLARFPSQPQSPIRILIMEDGLAQTVNPGLQQFVRDSPPRVRGQWLTGSIPDEEPGLTQEEFKKAMSKLRKHIFSPTYPRRRAWKRGLFSKSPANNNNVEDDDNDKGTECAICLEALLPNQEVLLTPCNHMFHRECLVPWVKSHGRCPVCRYAFVERRTNAPPTNNANVDYTTNGVMDLISLIRAMEEAFEWIHGAH